MIEKIDVSFDFGKLLRNLSNVFKQDLIPRKLELAKFAKETIKGGKLRKLKKSTLDIRKNGLTRAYGKSKPTDSTKPLIHTGNMLKSIKVTKDGIKYTGYGTKKNPNVHMTTHIVPKNDWSDKFNTVGKKVVARNFLFTYKGNLPPALIKKYKSLEHNLYKIINKYLSK